MRARRARAHAESAREASSCPTVRRGRVGDRVGKTVVDQALERYGAVRMNLHHRSKAPRTPRSSSLANSLGTTLELWDPTSAHGDEPPGAPVRRARPRRIRRPARAVLSRAARPRRARPSRRARDRARVLLRHLARGAIGLWLAANAPERIERLVVACSSARFGEPDRVVRASRARPRRGDGGDRRRRGGALVHAGCAARRSSPRTARCWRRRRPRATRRAVRRSRRGTSASALGEIRADTLVIAGAEDPAAPLATRS